MPRNSGQKRLEQRKPIETSYIELWPESLSVMLEFWYIERGLLIRVPCILYSIFSAQEVFPHFVDDTFPPAPFKGE